MGDISF